MMFPFTNWGGYGIIGPVFMLLFWMALIWGIVSLVQGSRERRDHEPPRTSPTRADALAILKERYVKGEITKAQFAEMRKDIEM
ncbi:SHOCT domain-containing protein [Patescibacteria group bacterium]|nr:MAG: SHOCT domain-containing protein [Patescibacteria group bacterium]